ncbi:MAG TPA: hypothetical protein VEW90_05090 [Gaiellaceae bacterium]|jgi:hypothetical protein|nr:hypothetical protein [Gaiellaceae bacterium]
MRITRHLSRALLTVAVGAIAVAAMLALPAQAQGHPTPDQLSAAGWTCFQPPVSPPRIVCANPGLGRPFPGNPDPPPAYTLSMFDLAGSYVGKVHLIRADLYAGQKCGGSGEPYVLNPRIPYYECFRAS